MSDEQEFGRKAKDRNGPGVTPFRYPGGKAFLADLLESKIRTYKKITTYAEPYAGGAGAAIELMARGTVERIALNDFDRRIHSAWWAILHRTDDFVERIRATTVDLATWYACRQIVEENRLDGDPFELGFATYFLNRTNRSGVIVGAGPIGGYAQTGKWLIDARWYPDTMCKRIIWLGQRRDRIELTNLDGIAFIKSFPKKRAKETFFFIDPPYVQAGAKLYLNAMNDLKHRDLAQYLTGNPTVPNWLVTYDDCQLIREVYAAASVEQIPVRYSLQRKRTEHEICVVPA
ncbi:DNA adenine methylase [Sphingopyxis granuli]|uniref:DNA adenine methylase n=1 Tax=Sphingopyxis granuli TaxID=267128 RepID=UPI0009EE654E|nr:DNA adenine methylase [Sphingopyxis granuli]